MLWINAWGKEFNKHSIVSLFLPSWHPGHDLLWHETHQQLLCTVMIIFLKLIALTGDWSKWGDTALGSRQRNCWVESQTGGVQRNVWVGKPADPLSGLFWHLLDNFVYCSEIKWPSWSSSVSLTGITFYCACCYTTCVVVIIRRRSCKIMFCVSSGTATLTNVHMFRLFIGQKYYYEFIHYWKPFFGSRGSLKW